MDSVSSAAGAPMACNSLRMLFPLVSIRRDEVPALIYAPLISYFVIIRLGAIEIHSSEDQARLPLLVADPRIAFPAHFADAASAATFTGPGAHTENVASKGKIKASVRH